MSLRKMERWMVSPKDNGRMDFSCKIWLLEFPSIFEQVCFRYSCPIIIVGDKAEVIKTEDGMSDAERMKPRQSSGLGLGVEELMTVCPKVRKPWNWTTFSVPLRNY
jgi:hypothetical protein